MAALAGRRPETVHLVGLSGNLERPSKTRALVAAAVQGAETLFDAEGTVLDLVDFAPSLGQAVRPSDLSGSARAAFDALLAADALIVGSPTYKGSYSGLLKHLIDLVDPAAWRGKPVLLLATGGGDRHVLMVEHQLRPLFGFFEALTLGTAVYAADRDFERGEPASPALLDRLARATGQFGPFLPARTFAPVRASA